MTFLTKCRIRCPQMCDSVRQGVKSTWTLARCVRVAKDVLKARLIFFSTYWYWYQTGQHPLRANARQGHPETRAYDPIPSNLHFGDVFDHTAGQIRIYLGLEKDICCSLIYTNGRLWERLREAKRRRIDDMNSRISYRLSCSKTKTH
jgi:hypothetical protein